MASTSAWGTGGGFAATMTDVWGTPITATSRQGQRSRGSKKGNDNETDNKTEEDDLLVYEMGVVLPVEVQGLPKAQLLTYPVRVGKRTVNAMLDSGATVNAMSAELLQAIGGTLQPARERIRYANGQTSDPEGVAEVTLQAKGHSSQVRCVVIEGLGSGLLLGRPWLCEWNPTVDWATGVLQFSDGVKWIPAKKVGVDEAAVGALQAPIKRMGEKGKRRVWQEMKEVEADEKPLSPPAWEGAQQFEEVFEEPSGISPHAEVVHELRLLPNTRPIRKKPFRMTQAQKEALGEELTKFRAKGWIRPSKSPWATVALVVPKKDATWRVCIDYRDLNAVTVMDAYPLPKIDELLTRLAKARAFSKVDLHSGFHQIPWKRRVFH